MRLVPWKSQVILLCGPSDDIEGNPRLLCCHHFRILGPEVSKITRHGLTVTVGSWISVPAFGPHWIYNRASLKDSTDTHCFKQGVRSHAF